MKRLMIVLSLLVFLVGCLTAQEMKAIPRYQHPIDIGAAGSHVPSQNRVAAPTFTFVKPPTTLLTSYWDYMIGGYCSLPVRVQPTDQGNGIYMAYTAQRSAAGTRRVFYTYLDASYNVQLNAEITSTNIREGYVSTDIDEVSGKPFFAWHVDSETNDTDLEDLLVWDMFVDNTAGWISSTATPINNPTTITSINGTTTDNDFDWPYVNVGPSPLADHRRVYISTTNSTSHTVSSNPSENIYLAYADFTTEMLDSDTPLTWSYTSIAEMDNWNTDMSNFRRPYYTGFPTEDGRYIIAGHHIAQDAASNSLHEPYVDVIMNSNYGMGEWTRYSVNPNEQIVNPVNPHTNQGYFEDSDGNPYPYLHMSVIEGYHITATLDRMGLVHFPTQFAVFDPNDSLYYPLTQFMKDIQFNTNTHEFKVRDLYPQDLNPNDDHMCLPWDLEGNGPQWTESTSTPGTWNLNYTSTWNYVYWDDAAVDDAMTFHYSTMKFTKMNEQGMMAAVWSNCARAKDYQEYPADYPELAPYAGLPEIFISVYPVNSENGKVWSDPIELNSVDVPEFKNGTANIVPEWPYPSDIIEYTGTSNEGYPEGNLTLLFFDDNSWGASSISPAVGAANGGRVMYTVLHITWPTVANDTHTAPAVTKMLGQNYPNPFNPTTSISYTLPQAGHASLKIYNVKGQVVKTLVNENTTAGSHTVSWNGLDDNNKNVASGLYFYTLQNGNHKETKKMMLVK